MVFFYSFLINNLYSIFNRHYKYILRKTQKLELQIENMYPVKRKKQVYTNYNVNKYTL